MFLELSYNHLIKSQTEGEVIVEKETTIPFSEKLKILRQARGLTAKATAEAIGVSLSTYKDWEYGRKISGEPYLKIAAVFGVGLNELFGNDVKSYSELREAIATVKIAVARLERTCESLF